jgi:hypothetical protein
MGLTGVCGASQYIITQYHFLEQKFVCLHDGTLHLFRVIRYRFEPDCFLVSHFDNMYELGLQWG